ncbi:uncharacterized protein G2W53_024075 [Senna tora]|uniref:Uncharacterized protein n=1 Tax=Senna tora TaxID=362788 RepID=A0A834TCN9_9FABA|nr:uncharacterized protein G2W53_024075 [Senna tora]
MEGEEEEVGIGESEVVSFIAIAIAIAMLVTEAAKETACVAILEGKWKFPIHSFLALLSPTHLNLKSTLPLPTRKATSRHPF